ncbi:hypothetical protein DACRYDRAFT_96032 [Dacryopinax primogenitus]|uniref:ERCC4 domain-containing protein n=1 Tax=Dacryopinax primogenitus (strain DJM 731) TaxID=1858805 RepID=M5G7M1_DACPD|nr:uncharacterized protein DACRYDRAFT_96032 [Dacryopinax primogenitus]EJT99777.1 hypothetical protein DACRYDRAFT_96032 [Dacryopinax primogenitus]
MTTLLPFQKHIIDEFHSPNTSELLILARGLGLRKILCTLLKIYDSPSSLVLLVGASPEEEVGIGEELGVMGVRRPGLRVVDYEMPRAERREMYKAGGLVSVTSRILVVDMLQRDIPVDKITGMVVLHAEKVSPTSTESFIVRLFRESNPSGFLKAFSGEPEFFQSGFSPLRSVMKELRISIVRLYPRFHELVQESLSKRTADVVEIYQPMSESMREIHRCITECMEATLGEIKRSHTTLDLDDLTVEAAYFPSSSNLIRHLLDPVWHRVGPRTNQLVKDLAELRRLLRFLLAYPPITFLKYLESIVASNTVSETGAAKVHQSPWLYMDAANSMIVTAKVRCYTLTEKAKSKGTITAAAVDGHEPHDDELDVLDEWEGLQGRTKKPGKVRPKWLPEGMTPVYEELPKWDLLRRVLLEIEEIMVQNPYPAHAPGTNLVLIMVQDHKTCALLREYLTSLPQTSSSSEVDPENPPGKKMLDNYLREYVFWKGRGLRHTMQAKKELGKGLAGGGGLRRVAPGAPDAPESADRAGADRENGVSEALLKKDKLRERVIHQRRRMRGGKPPEPVGRSILRGGAAAEEVKMEEEAVELEEFIDATHASPPPLTLNTMSEEDIVSLVDRIDSASFDQDFGIIPDEQIVLIRAYGDDSDDLLLAELQPRWIIMYEPDQAFIRRVEVYRSSHPGLAVRVYFMVYEMTSEDYMYLASQRREKDAFAKLIEERATMLNPILEQPTRAGTNDLIKTISSRIAGGGNVVNSEPTRIIVDMREFRSSLPSLLHATNIQIVPATLTVGDYVLTPDMVVERKSVPDLVQSFNSGRLYTQCELMSVHYKQPILLIEFEQDKSFSLQTISETRSQAKTTKPNQPAEFNTPDMSSIQAKLVLLTLAFHRLGIIWSSSPFATAKIFADLKMNHPEPDPSRAIQIGAEEGGGSMAEGGWNNQAEDLVRCFPGITSKNVRYVMGKVASVKELCKLSKEEMESLLGTDGGKQCYNFVHRGTRKEKGA